MNEYAILRMQYTAYTIQEQVDNFLYIRFWCSMAEPYFSSTSSTNTSSSQDFDIATLAERVYMRLRGDILSNIYPPDEPLPEEAIATKLNVSRAPVREALRRLAAEGLVTLIRRQGAVVSSLTPQEFLDAYQIREALEILAIRLAVSRLEPADLEELERLNQIMVECVANNDIDKFFSTNAAFHSIFTDRSGNQKLREIYYSLVNQMRRYYLPSLYLRGGMERSTEEHQEIIHALREGDPDRAAQLLHEHIQVPQRILDSNKQIELAPVTRSA